VEYFQVQSFAAAFQNVDVTVVASGAPLTSAANCGFTQVGGDVASPPLVRVRVVGV
jgi:hypothetical protein